MAPPQQQVPYPTYRQYPMHYPVQTNIYGQTAIPTQVGAHLNQPQFNGYPHANAGTIPHPVTNGLRTGVAPTNLPHQPYVNYIQPNMYQHPPPVVPPAGPSTSTCMPPQQPTGIWPARQVPQRINGHGLRHEGQSLPNSNKQQPRRQDGPPENGKYNGKRNELRHSPRDDSNIVHKMDEPAAAKNPIYVIDLEAQDLPSTREYTDQSGECAANKATETNNPRKRQLKQANSNDPEDIIKEKRPHISTQTGKSTKLIEVIDSCELNTDITTQNLSRSGNETEQNRTEHNFYLKHVSVHMQVEYEKNEYIKQKKCTTYITWQLFCVYGSRHDRC